MCAISITVSGDKKGFLPVVSDMTFLHLFPGEGKSKGAACSPALPDPLPAVNDCIRQPLLFLAIYCSDPHFQHFVQDRDNSLTLVVGDRLIILLSVLCIIQIIP